MRSVFLAFAYSAKSGHRALIGLQLLSR
jgi:hypothetical protein